MKGFQSVKKKSRIADETEIMEMYTSIIRREISDPTKIGQDIVDVPVKAADMMKAAEQLLKRLDAAVPDQEEGDRYGVILMPPTEEDGGELSSERSNKSG